VQPKLIIHGGAGSSLESKSGVETVRKSLYQVVGPVYQLLLSGASAQTAVIHGCQMLEDGHHQVHFLFVLKDGSPVSVVISTAY